MDPQGLMLPFRAVPPGGDPGDKGPGCGSRAAGFLPACPPGNAWPCLLHVEPRASHASKQRRQIALEAQGALERVLP